MPGPNPRLTPATGRRAPTSVRGMYATPMASVPVVDPAPPAAAPAEPVAPLTGQGPPIVTDGAPLDAGTPAAPTTAQRSHDLPPAPPLAVPPRARAGLGEPMSGLPPTATSWDLTTLSPAEQRLASRALVQRQLAHAAGTNPIRTPPVVVAGPPMADSSAGRPPPELVLAGTPGPRAVLEGVEPITAGVYPEGLPPAGPEEAPVLSMDPLVGFPASDEGRPAPAGGQEGARAREVVGQRYGVDLSHVPINRSPHAAVAADQMGAPRSPPTPGS